LLDAEELAQWSPAILYLVDQQLLLRDAPLDLLVVPIKDLYGVVFVLEAAVEGTLLDNLLGHRALPGLEGAEYEQGEEREAQAGEGRAGADPA
jgi:hypothetical protein